MKFPDEVLIQHIINECNKIQNILSEISYEKFLSVTMYQDALIRPLEVIGEAAGNLSAEFVEKNPAIPVSNMKGMRNLLMHQYFRVDLNLVWQTCVTDIPPIREYLLALVK
ncbi:DUF86 domain-containing protein [Methanocorpusculum sp.]|nr:DUF86 domain-containing protein [Methanocorpusculum sp.]